MGGTGAVGLVLVQEVGIHGYQQGSLEGNPVQIGSMSGQIPVSFLFQLDLCPQVLASQYQRMWG
jgi:hypothetical protein